MGIRTVFRFQCNLQVAHIGLTIKQSDWVILVTGLSYFRRVTRLVIVWQSSSEENLSVVIGASSAMIVPCASFHKQCFFVRETCPEFHSCLSLLITLWRFKPNSHVSDGLRLRGYRVVARNRKLYSRFLVFALVTEW